VNKRRSLRSRFAGQAMTEFVIIIPVLVLLIFGAIQIAFIYSAKITLNYATFQAARVGANEHATYSALRRGLVRGLAPLFTSTSSMANVKEDIAAGIDSGETRRSAVSEVDNYVRIIRLSPSMSNLAPSGFGEKNELGYFEIPNDNLMYRPDASSKGSIQDANLLKIRVQYCYKLMVPIVNKIIGSLAEAQNKRNSADYHAHDTFNDPRFADRNRGAVDGGVGTLGQADYQALCKGRAEKNEGFIITAEAIVRMQSAAYDGDPDEEVGDRMCNDDHMACP
jgi:hypothetical protein